MADGWLNLKRWLPVKDVRKLIWGLLTKEDKLVIKIAHNRDRKVVLSWLFSYYCAENGYLELLKWARENGCDWDWWTCAYAAKGGHLDVLKWVRQNGCDWDEWTCIYAAKGGHLEVLKWARESGCPWDEWTCIYAAKDGHLENT
jgi:hypothetical protein